MNFSCTQENLNLGLSVVSHITNRSVNLPILGNVLIKAEGTTLKLQSTNLEVAISCVVRGKINEEGDFTVPSKLFSEYVALLPKDSRVDAVSDGKALAVSCGQNKTRLAGLPSSEFPLIPKVEAERRFKVKVSDFRKAVGQVLFAVAPNESRPEISGVLFRFVQNEGGMVMTLAATDSYRLAEKTITMTYDGEQLIDPVSVIVPARTVSEIVRILGVFKDGLGSQENLEISLGNGQVLFSFEGVEMSSRTIEGKYPDYQQLIPSTFITEVVISRDELVRAVKTSSLFSRSGLNDVHISFAEDKPITLSAMNSQTGEHKVEVEGDVSGKESNITVNFKYFLDGVSNIDSDRVLVQMNDSLSPCILRPVTEHGDSDYLYIVMPIRQ